MQMSINYCCFIESLEVNNLSVTILDMDNQVFEVWRLKILVDSAKIDVTIVADTIIGGAF